MSPSADRVRSLLLPFYDRTCRRLPWREARDPYAIWVSEIMLQQTRVDTVIPYYVRWLERFPTLRVLAAAELDEVLRCWKGLGYYSRARNLHSGARMVVDRYGGELPREPGRLKELPGIGDYTAGALASIAFGVRVAAVDGNARRVLARLYDVDGTDEARMRSRAEGLVDPERPGDWNQALMDLGASVCTWRGPRCGECPLRSVCLARARGTVGERPARKRRRVVPDRHFLVAVAVDPRDRMLLRKRPPRGLLGGMWEFPGIETRARPGPDGGRWVDLEAVLAGLLDLPGLGEPAPLGHVQHAYTHFRAHYAAFLFEVDGPIKKDGGRTYRWASSEQAKTLALPVAQQKILALASEGFAELAGH